MSLVGQARTLKTPEQTTIPEAEIGATAAARVVRSRCREATAARHGGG